MRVFGRKSALLASVAALSLLLGAPSGPAGAADYLADAKALMAKGDLKGAQLQLRNAVRSTPDGGEAHQQLARVDLSLGDVVAAEREARAARDLGYDPGGSTRLLAEAYLAQGRTDSVLKDFVVAGKDPAVDSAVLVARGFALAGQDKMDDAQQSFVEAARLQPKAAEPLFAQGRLAMARGDLAAAAERTDAGLALAPDAVDGRLQKAQLLRAKSDEQGALTVLDGVIADQPGSIPARNERARVLITLGQDEKARQDVQAALAVQPGNPLATFLQADILYRAQNYQAADALLTKFGDRLGQIPRGYLLQAAIKQKLGQNEEAEDAARRAVTRTPDDVEALKLLARLELARREPDKVIETLGPVSKTARADAEIQDLLAAAFAAIGDGKDSVDSVKKALALQPDNVGLLAQLGRLQTGTGDVEGAIATFRHALDIAPKQAQLAELLYFATLSTGDLDRTADAVKFAREKLGPEVPEAGNLEGLLKLARLDPEGARASFAAVLKTHPDFLPARINIARVDGVEGRSDQMMAQLADLLAANPSGEPTLSMYVNQLEQQGKVGEAEAALEKAHAAKPDNVQLTGRYAEFELRRNNFKKALELASPAKDAAPNVPMLAVQAAAQMALGQKDVARDTLTRLLAIDPGQVEQRRRLAGLMLAAGDGESARKVVQAGLSLDPRNIQLLYDYVSIDAKTGGVDAGLETAKRLQEQAQDFPPARGLQGDLLMNEKRFDDAIQSYGDALKAAPSAYFALRLAAAQQAAGKLPDAVQSLAKWNAAHPGEQGTTDALSQLYIGQHDYKNAAAVLQTEVDKQPRNALALNNLAWTYQQLGDKRARALAQKAYTLLPGAQTADTLGWILTGEGDATQGVTLLRQAVGDAANDPRLQYHLAVALSDTGKKDEAKQVLQTIVDRKQEFDEKPAAQKLLAELSKA